MVEAEFHHHPLTPFWKWITFTCDICGKEDKDKGMPYMCQPCGLWIHRSCASFPRSVKVMRHKHLLHLTLSSLEFLQPDPRICQLCVQKLDTRYGLYYCSKCDFVAHLDCAIFKENREDIDMQKFEDEDEVPELDELVDLELTNGFTYNCTICEFDLDVVCSLKSDIFTHEGHEHRLILSNTTHTQKCNCCDNERCQVFRCTTCEFVLDFQCATLPHTTRYGQHEHPFTLSYRVEDDSGEYYCDICEEERQDLKYWFYYCEDCSYPTHPNCIIGKYPNYKFGGAHTFDCHSHPLTFVEENKDHP
ncbi:uncharacterized protein LOC142628374 [Castanea sativa]|uniref:uncharacterized protein LOC142628374 n=1 Tax=Castanea sativa TaxID=21020 RepID=UPI003F6498BE